MELAEIIKKYRKHKKILFLSFVVGIIGGFLYFLAPSNYKATGSFYINRAVDTTQLRYFAYEGYYAQQTGLSYTNTVLALLESMDVLYESLTGLGMPTDITNLKKYSNLIKVKKSGPQVITLSVKGNSPQISENLWNKVAEVALEKNKQINLKGDPLLSISKISENPVVTEQYKPLWICISFGVVFSFSIVVFYLNIKEYFKWK